MENTKEKKTDFISMVKKNIISDYYSPNIKAEVILDMLLTDEIAGIIENSKSKKTNSEVKFITKEMSIGYGSDVEADSNNQGKKVDYVAFDDEFMYLVELKTTWGSMGKAQRELYEAIQEKEKNAIFLLDKLSRILNCYDKGKSSYEQLGKYLKSELTKNQKQWSCSEDEFDSYKAKNNLTELVQKYQKKKGISGTKKYIHTIANILDYTDEKDWNNKVKIVYIYPNKRNSNSNHQLFDINTIAICLNDEAVVENIGNETVKDIISELFL